MQKHCEQKGVDTSQKMEDEELVFLCKQGDKRAFSTLISRYGKVIKSKSGRYKFSNFDLDDLRQEGWIGFLSAVESFNQSKGIPFFGFANVCIQNRINSAVSKLIKTGKDPNVMSLNSQFEKIEQLNFEKVSTPEKEDPESVFFNKDYESYLFSKMKSVLSEKEYKIIMLFLSGLSYNEISNEINVNIKSIDNSLQRIRKKIREVV